MKCNRGSFVSHQEFLHGFPGTNNEKNRRLGELLSLEALEPHFLAVFYHYEALKVVPQKHAVAVVGVPNLLQERKVSLPCRRKCSPSCCV